MGFTVYRGRLKQSRNHVTLQKLFFLNKIFRHIYLTSLNTYIKCILACSASLLRAQSGGFEYSFRVIQLFFIFVIHFGNDRQIRSLICKVKSTIHNPLFYLSKLAEQAKIRLHYNFQVYINFSL